MKGWGRRVLAGGLLVGIVAFLVSRLSSPSDLTPKLSLSPQTTDARLSGMRWIPGGTFLMGNDFGQLLDAAPAHRVRLDGFWIDEHEVTNRQFGEFIEKSRYVTTAEKLGFGYVLDLESYEWQRVDGASWRRPKGRDSISIASPEYPVVQVSYEDAVAYCRWAGKRLATEAEWERAARGKLQAADYPWGKTERLGAAYLANYWQGDFPREDLGEDGFFGPSPIGRFPPNGHGLFDVCGNVWEWCSDWYDSSYYHRSVRNNPQGPAEGETRVIRGGSWLSNRQGRSITVWARGKLGPELMNFQTGFRCVSDEAPDSTPK